MLPIDLLTYFPSYADIPDSAVQSMRQRLATLHHQFWPDIDARPGSPFGDQALTPIAYLLAAAEIACGRVLSDADLGNVAQGIIYNCDWVREYLKNFAITEAATLQASGIVRLTFTTNQDYLIDRRARYNFSGNIFNLRLPFDGPLQIRAVGTPLEGGTNTRNLVEITPGIYVVDLPLLGTMTTPVLAGADASTDFPITEMVSAVALVDFDDGLPPESLAVLAQRTRETFYAATPNTRGGAARFIGKEFPELVGISPVETGDAEMMRDVVNPLGIGDGRIDLYVRSKRTVVDTMTIKVPYIDAQSYEAIDRFVVKLQLTGIPFQIDSITAVSDPTLALTDKVIFSRSLDPARAPMASAAYSELEELWLTIGMPKDPITGDNLIPLDIDENGKQSALFNITFRFDPLLKPVIDVMASDDSRPVRIDVLTKGFVPILISSFTVKYTRSRGVSVDLTNAGAEIEAYINTLSLPVRYSDARVNDSMFYAKANNVLGITCQAVVAWSIADRFLKPGTPTPDADYAAALAGSVTARLITMVNSASLTPVYKDYRLGTSNAGYEAIGLRNRMLCMDASALNFEEIAEQ